MLLNELRTVDFFGSFSVPNAEFRDLIERR